MRTVLPLFIVPLAQMIGRLSISMRLVLALLRISQINMVIRQLTQSQMMGQGNPQDQPNIARQVVLIQGNVDGVRALRRYARWVLLVSGRFSLSKTIIPEAREHFLIPSPRCHTDPFGGLGLTLVGRNVPNAELSGGWSAAGSSTGYVDGPSLSASRATTEMRGTHLRRRRTVSRQG